MIVRQLFHVKIFQLKEKNWLKSVLIVEKLRFENGIQK